MLDIVIICAPFMIAFGVGGYWYFIQRARLSQRIQETLQRNLRGGYRHND